MSKLLEVKNVSKFYRMGDTTVHALKNVSVSIEAGDFVAIMGPSGSGKSTLMNVLGLLDSPSEGEYRIEGENVAQLNEESLAILRRKKLGFIFQQFNLLPRMTATENAGLPLFYSAPNADDSIPSRLLDEVGLGKRKSHKTNELSGGQQQRVAIARALVNSPTIILADEPTGNLDSQSERDIMDILRRLNDDGITVIIVTHEEEIGAQAKRRIRMRDGEVQVDERLAPLKASKSQTHRAPAGVEDSSTQNGTNESANPLSTLFTQGSGHIRQALKTLWSNKIRTALSMLGILVGVAAVITMLAIGTGAQKEIEKQLSSLGSNLLILRPGATRVGGVTQENSATRLTPEDATALRSRIPSIINTTPTVQGRGQVTFGNKNWNTQVTGAEPIYATMRSNQPTVGRFFSESENQTRAMVAVIGATVARELFGAGVNPVGETIKINRLNFSVIGILPVKGSGGFRDQDDAIVVPLQTAMRRLFGQSYVETIELEVAKGAQMSQVEDQVMEVMTSRHRVRQNPTSNEDPFRIMNMADLQAALTSSSKTMSALLAAIAAISLLVGGIGIMNIMLVSVTERTREIGLRKAIGARPVDILLQFLIESVAMTFIGGLAGIALGWIATASVGATLGWSTEMTPASIALATLFSISIGMIFGIYPARRAAQLNPIQALRHE